MAKKPEKPLTRIGISRTIREVQHLFAQARIAAISKNDLVAGCGEAIPNLQRVADSTRMLPGLSFALDICADVAHGREVTADQYRRAVYELHLIGREFGLEEAA